MKLLFWRSAVVLIWLQTVPLRAEHSFPEITFGAYNLENYTLSGSERTRPKPQPACDAVSKVVSSVRPDILGLCEVGEEAALTDLQQRLSALGLDFPHREYVPGPDPDRRLALLSRFPIVRRSNQSGYHRQARPNGHRSTSCSTCSAKTEGPPLQGQH